MISNPSIASGDRRKSNPLWTMLSDRPPVFVGLAGAVMMVFEGRIADTFLVLILVAIHRFAGTLLRHAHPSSDRYADWTGVRAMTTVCCLALPFYLALTLS